MASGLQCHDVFSTRQGFNPYLEKLLERIEQLNPELRDRVDIHLPPSMLWKEIYLLLKEEAWVWLPQGQLPWKDYGEISVDLQRRWKNFFSSSYRVQNLSEKELRVFYANSLQGLYQNAIILYLRHLVETTQRPLTAELNTRLVDFLLNKAPVDFMLADLHPARAREVLDQWSPHQDLMTLFSYFPHLSEQPRPWKFSDFLQGSTRADLSAPRQIMAIEKMSDKRRRINCCLNQPGCLFCPTNRGFLIPRRTDPQS